MGDQFRVDPEGLRKQAARMAGLGDQLGRIHADLRDALALADGSWGDDYMGKAFAENFEPNSQALLAGLRDMRESLHGMAEGTASAADHFESQDLRGRNLIDPNHTGPADPLPGRRVPPDITPPADVAPNVSPGPDFPASAPPGPGSAGPAVPGPAAGPPAGAGGPMPNGQSSPGGSPGAEAPGGRAASPDSGSPRGVADQRPGTGPGPRTASAPVSASPWQANASRPPAAVSPQPGRTPGPGAVPGSGPRSAAGAGSRESPWAGRPSGTARQAEAPQPQAPRPASPPRPPAKKPEEDRPVRPQPKGTDEHDVLRWLARSLADRHDVEVVGFDLPGLRVPVVRRFAAAVDRVLTEYPAITLDVVRVSDLGDDSGGVRWSSASPDRPVAAIRSIILDRRAASEPAGEEDMASESEDGTPESGIYAATLREFGRALDAAGGGIASRTAQRVLIAEHMRGMAGRYTTLAQLLRSYRKWRAVLTGTESIGFDADRVLGAAFADVVLHGAEASAQAKSLYKALIGAAPKP